jgi:hypothetical protein
VSFLPFHRELAVAFQIVEVASQDKDVDRTKVFPEPFETREQAVGEIEALIALHGDGGYSKEKDQWWARDKSGIEYRFVIQQV